MDFSSAIHVGDASDLLETIREVDSAPVVPVSGGQRGLALRSLTVRSGLDGLWSFLGRRQDIYFLSVAFDLSGMPPTIRPPEILPESAVHRVKKGEAIRFTLGEGAPLFPARSITGGLSIYITVCEADGGARHVGEVMKKVHEQLARKGSLVEELKKLVKNPGATIADEILSVATAALQPISTILKESKDDFVALFQGYYPAKGPWADRLHAEQSGTVIELVELA